jgi:glutaredoxin
MITLYSTHCPQCKALEMKLNKKKIEYIVCDDENKMKELGFTSAPILDVDGTTYTFANAIKWVNSQL